MGLTRYLKNIFRHDSYTRRLIHELRLELQSAKQELVLNYATKESSRIQYLQDKVLNTTEMGVSDIPLCENEVVVSLTTYGIRIHDVYLAIESIMQGTIKPNRIVLWLSKDEFEGKKIPLSLQNQMKRGLEIEYCEDILSYKKLIPSLKKFPNACIITIDDDLMYDFDFVERLVNTHIMHKEAVCANRIHRMKLGKNMLPVSYMDWDLCVNKYDNSPLNFFTTGGGTLFPPNVFPKEVFDDSTFMSICKYADDVWFNAMIRLNDKVILKSYTRSSEGDDFICISNVQYMGLYIENTNSISCRNDVQIDAVWKKYKLSE